jgi:thiol:disulfide interchange protein
MGLVMLWATAALFALFTGEYKVQTFALFMALWCTCWWIGKTPLTAEFGQKLRAWAVGVAFSAIVAVCLFTNVVGTVAQWAGAVELDWEPFSIARLEKLKAEGTTVFVDFTADW